MYKQTSTDMHGYASGERALQGRERKEAKETQEKHGIFELLCLLYDLQTIKKKKKKEEMPRVPLIFFDQAKKKKKKRKKGRILRSQ